MAGYTIIANDRTAEVQVHSETCRDISRLAESGRGWEIIVTAPFKDRWEAFLSYNEDFWNEGLYESEQVGKDSCYHVDFKGCCRKLKNGVWPEVFGVKPEPVDEVLPSPSQEPAPKAIIEAAISAGEARAAAAACPGGEESHNDHMDLNGECPWCGAATPELLKKLDHELVEMVDGAGMTTWECTCGYIGKSRDRKLANESYRRHAREAKRA